MITDYRDIKVDYIYSIKEKVNTKKIYDIPPIDELALVEEIRDDSDGEGDNTLTARTIYSVDTLEEDELEWDTTPNAWIDEYIVKLIGHKDDFPEYFL